MRIDIKSSYNCLSRERINEDTLAFSLTAKQTDIHQQILRSGGCLWQTRVITQRPQLYTLKTKHLFNT